MIFVEKMKITQVCSRPSPPGWECRRRELKRNEEDTWLVTFHVLLGITAAANYSISPSHPAKIDDASDLEVQAMIGCKPD
jgi:hypothetical protein